jgi:hypothetical protein
MTTNQASIHQLNLSNLQQPKTTHRRTFLGGAMAALLASQGRAIAEDTDAPSNPFIVLLKGLYQKVPVGQGPISNFGLTTVNLSSGAFSKTQIFAVFGISDTNNDDNHEGKAIGTFYVGGGHCAYDLPGGSIAMQFTGGGGFSPTPILDGNGGQFDQGTFELTIQEATGIYSAFKGGDNHMVDRLDQLVKGPVFANFPASGYDEFCFCIISQYPFP